MHDVLAALVNREYPVDEDMWRSFWDRLRDRQLRRGEAVALLASLSTQLPDDNTLHALLNSLHERAPQPTLHLPDVVNIVGTGGGPKTFNISTAAAFVAAAMGVRVVKTGSRAYSSSYGSIDILNHLGVPLANSYEQVDELLGRYGISFAGYFVYPKELSLLAQSMRPFDMRLAGRFLNFIGPFLASISTSAQLTGVSDHALLPSLRFLAARDAEKCIWLCVNNHQADELISFSANIIHSNDGTSDIQLSPTVLNFDPGTMTDLRPVSDGGPVVDHFLAQLSGDGPRAALQTICLNAAALAVLSGTFNDWPAALRSARDVIGDGTVTHLVEQLRKHPQRVSISMSTGASTHV